MPSQKLITALFGNERNTYMVSSRKNEAIQSQMLMAGLNLLQGKFSNLYLYKLKEVPYVQAIRDNLRNTEVSILGLEQLNKNIIVSIFSNFPDSVTYLGLDRIAPTNLDYILQQLNLFCQHGRRITVVLGDYIAAEYQGLFEKFSEPFEPTQNANLPAAIQVANAIFPHQRKRQATQEDHSTVICRQVMQIQALTTACDAYKRHAGDAKAEIPALTSEIELLRANNFFLQQQASEAKAQVSLLSSEVDLLRAHNSALLQQGSEAKTEISSLSAEVELLHDAIQLQSADKDAQISSLTLEVEFLGENNNELIAQLKETLDCNQTLITNQRKMQVQIEELDYALSQSNPRATSENPQASPQSIGYHLPSSAASLLLSALLVASVVISERSISSRQIHQLIQAVNRQLLAFLKVYSHCRVMETGDTLHRPLF